MYNFWGDLLSLQLALILQKDFDAENMISFSRVLCLVDKLVGTLYSLLVLTCNIYIKNFTG